MLGASVVAKSAVALVFSRCRLLRLYSCPLGVETMYDLGVVTGWVTCAGTHVLFWHMRTLSFSFSGDNGLAVLS